MTYLILAVAVVIFFLGLHFLTKLTNLQKLAITLSLLGVVLFSIAFNSHTAKIEAQTREIILKFTQGKTVVCKGIDVNSTNFTYSKGTQSFIANADTEHFGRILDAEQCR